MPIMSGSSIVPSTGGVARQDLLDQRRAGARQADDEDRIGRLRSRGRARAAKNSRREHGVERRTWSVVSSASYGTASWRSAVALGVVVEGLRVLRRVLERLAEREVEVEAVLGREVVARKLGAHRREVGVA